MLSNQILQNCIDGTKNITRREISVIEREGKVVASTDNDEINTVVDSLESFMSSLAESQLVQGAHYFKIFDNGITEYVLRIAGEDDETYRIGKLTSFQIQSLINAYKERYDKDNFLKNLLLDNLLLVDVYSRAKKLNVDNALQRVVYIVEFDTTHEVDTIQAIRTVLPDRLHEYLTSIDEKGIILIKELNSYVDAQAEIMQTAESLYSAIVAQEVFENVKISIGTVVNDLKNVSQSYKEARLAMEVGKIFGSEVNIINYGELGIGRLIYQLPINLCRMFINEVLQGVTIDQFDEESLVTVNKFFENNLNVSETSRQLYIHRNTLVYRLDKLQKMTDLDLRNFDDAIVLKITLMVARYLSYVENHIHK